MFLLSHGDDEPSSRIEHAPPPCEPQDMRGRERAADLEGGGAFVRALRAGYEAGGGERRGGGQHPIGTPGSG